MKVREEMYRRAHMECSPDQKRRIYSSRYTLSSIVYCARCNDIFCRINWNNRGCKSTVWRCLSRVEKDRPFCTARTVKEEPLHEEVVREVNEVITDSAAFIPTLQASFERCLGDSNSAAVAEIDARILELQQELLRLANTKQNYDDHFVVEFKSGIEITINE